MKQRTQYYKMVVDIFEKYGFNVVPCVDQKTILLSNLSEIQVSIPRRTMQLIVQYEDIDLYVADIEPFQVAGWKVTLW